MALQLDFPLHQDQG